VGIGAKRPAYGFRIGFKSNCPLKPETWIDPKSIIKVDKAQSLAFGQPITLSLNTRGAQQYRELAQELMNDGRASQGSA
jgi:hypothetical protein